MTCENCMTRRQRFGVWVRGKLGIADRAVADYVLKEFTKDREIRTRLLQSGVMQEQRIDAAMNKLDGVVDKLNGLYLVTQKLESEGDEVLGRINNAFNALDDIDLEIGSLSKAVAILEGVETAPSKLSPEPLETQEVDVVGSDDEIAEGIQGSSEDAGRPDLLITGQE